MNKQIQAGDVVTVNFNCAQTTLFRKATVLYKPQATGDSWVFEDMETGDIAYVSEGCTIIKTKQ